MVGKSLGLVLSGHSDDCDRPYDCGDAKPDVMVVAACGYDRQGTTALAHDLASRGVLPPRVRVVAVDANASWARPGTRLVNGIEELADFLHPATDQAVA